MQPRTALAVALAAAAVAVGIVAADTVYGLDLSVQSDDAGEWVTVWTDPDARPDRGYAYPVMYGDCGGPRFRVVADNDKPLPERVDVKVTYYDNVTKRTTTLLEERLALGTFEVKTLEFTVPDTAGPRGLDPYAPKEAWMQSVYATVEFDGGYVDGGKVADVCVRRDAR